MTFRIFGINDARDTLSRLVDEAEDEMGGALREEGEDIMSTSKPLVPVDLGVLRASGFVDGPIKIAPKKMRVTLGYGGAASAYALIQHERTDYHHTSGQAKYLEQPMRSAERGMGQRLKRRIRLRGR